MNIGRVIFLFGSRVLVIGLVAIILTGCAAVEHTAALVSRVKSPLTIALPPVDKPISSETNLVEHEVDDLASQDALFMVSLSGGGARAARMAVYAMAMIESNYNAACPTNSTTNWPSLFDRIDLVSSVSGGSLYASWLASVSSNSPSRYFRALSKAPEKQQLFQRFAGSVAMRYDTKELGSWAGVIYLSPGNLFSAPLAEFFADWDTLNLFADTHAFLRQGNFFLTSFRHDTLGSLPARPVFFFNSTCLDTGRPFIFTGSKLHDHPETNADNPLNDWVTGDDQPDPERGEPDPFAMTLEDIGASPTNFPIDYAVLASAAFPVIFQPLPLTIYSPLYGTNVLGTHRIARLVDGGVYDNSALVNALSAFDYVRGLSKKSPKLILLSIDANNTYHNLAGSTIVTNSPLTLSWPIRGVVQTLPTVDTIYDKEQSLVDTVIDQKIRHDTDIMFFRIRLNEDFSCPTNILNISKVATDFAISGNDDQTIQQAVNYLLYSNYWDSAYGRTNSKPVAARLVEALKHCQN